MSEERAIQRDEKRAVIEQFEAIWKEASKIERGKNSAIVWTEYKEGYNFAFNRLRSTKTDTLSEVWMGHISRATERLKSAALSNISREEKYRNIGLAYGEFFACMEVMATTKVLNVSRTSAKNEFLITYILPFIKLSKELGHGITQNDVQRAINYLAHKYGGTVLPERVAFINQIAAEFA